MAMEMPDDSYTTFLKRENKTSSGIFSTLLTPQLKKTVKSRWVLCYLAPVHGQRLGFQHSYLAPGFSPS